MKNPNSITGKYLSGKIKIPVPKTRRNQKGFLKVVGAKENNLKNIDVKLPIRVLTCVTGVSGSGKSSLVNEILYKSLARKLNRARTIPENKKIEGMEQLDKVINIDPSPIGRIAQLRHIYGNARYEGRDLCGNNRRKERGQRRKICF